jgi:ferritin-like metal-binding protein YciE
MRQFNPSVSLRLTIMKIQATSLEFTALLLSELQEMFWVERQLSQASLLMQEVAFSCDFVRTLEKGRVYSLNNQIVLLDIAESVQEELGGIVCSPVNNMIETIAGIANNLGNGTMKDMSMLLAIQKLIQYQIACYENLVTIVQIQSEKEWEEILNSIIIEKQEISILMRELSERYQYKKQANLQY